MIAKKKICVSLIILVSIILAAVVLTGCTETKQSTTGSAKAVVNGTTLSVHKVAKGPTIDGKADDAVWKKVEATEFAATGGEKVSIKAVYDEDMVYVTATWRGAEESGALKIWEYDGVGWKAPPGCYPTIGFLWDTENSIVGFKEKGCDVLCHKASADRNSWSMQITPDKAKADPDQRGDMWDISVSYARVTGLANDFNLGPRELNPVIEGAIGVGNIYMQPDPGDQDGPFDANGVDRPAYNLKDGLEVTDTPYPTYDQLEPITDYSVFKKGDTVPYFIVNKDKMADGIVYGGSRDDIKAKGSWADGMWTIEVERKLDTGNDDDIRFVPKEGKPYTFAVGIKGRSVNDFSEMFVTKPIDLVFE